MKEEETPSIAEKLGGIGNSLCTLFLFPSKRERQDYINRSKEAVDKYKPLIEKRTGVNLGEVGVKEFRYIMNDKLREAFLKIEKEYEENNFIIGKCFTKGLFYGLKPMFELFRMLQEDHTLAAYHDSTVYMPFGLATKIELFEESLDGKNQHLDESVVHELTHHLWAKIDGSMDIYKSPRILVEGFATYGETTWFADFYPSGRYSQNINNWFSGKPEMYKQGKKIIERLVEVCGEEVLLRVPKEGWRTSWEH